MMNVFNSRFHRIILIIMIIFIRGSIVCAQDSSSTRIKYFEKWSVKISSSLLLGEIPLIVEYRPFKVLGNELTAGYIYENFAPFTSETSFLGRTRCNGYKIKYGLKIYFDNDKNNILTKNRWWYVSPQFYYKQMWINDRVYYSNLDINTFFESYESDQYTYNENRIVYGGQVIFGFTKSKKIRTFEFYFGLGYRVIHSNREITDWDRVDPNGPYSSYVIDNTSNYSNMPKHASKIRHLPTLQVGCYWSFPFPFVKTRKYVIPE